MEWIFSAILVLAGYITGRILFGLLDNKFRQSGRPFLAVLVGASLLVILMQGIVTNELAGRLIEAGFIGFLGGFLWSTFRKGG